MQKNAIASTAVGAKGSVRLEPVDRLAEHMAEGCPSVTEAARRRRLTAAEGERVWRRIVRFLGRQAS